MILIPVSGLLSPSAGFLNAQHCLLSHDLSAKLLGAAQNCKAWKVSIWVRCCFHIFRHTRQDTRCLLCSYPIQQTPHPYFTLRQTPKPPSALQLRRA